MTRAATIAALGIAACATIARAAPAESAVFAARTLGAASEDAWRGKVDPALLAEVAAGARTAAPAPGEGVEFLAVLGEEADLDGVARIAGKAARGGFVRDALVSAARRAQAPLVAELGAAGIPCRPFWIMNLVWVRGDLAVIERVARHEEVRRVIANARLTAVDAGGESGEARRADRPRENEPARGIEWNLIHVRAPEVWATGDSGQSAVVGCADTGFDWDHPALIRRYRGWDGHTAHHDYNWHDAIHSGGGSCGGNSPEPCDNNGHGTHVMGTMVGDDGGTNRIGMAPGARWIGCRCLDNGWGTATTFLECLEWMLAPYPVGGSPAQGDPSMAPDVVTTAWDCAGAEGCAWDTLLPAIQHLRAAGIMVVAGSGGGGPVCSTIADPPAIYDETTTVGATTRTDLVTTPSGRGPVLVDGSGRVKPDLSAPGDSIRSSLPGGLYGVYSGTSMAAAHVAGLAALVLTARPELAGDVGAIEAAMETGAVPRVSSQCGDGSAIPNNVYGWGRIDAVNACAGGTTGVAGTGAGGSASAASAASAAGAASGAGVAVMPIPSTGEVVIHYRLASPGRATLVIYSVRGECVRALVDAGAASAGPLQVSWDGKDGAGRPAPPGAYFARLEAAGASSCARIMLVR